MPKKACLPTCLIAVFLYAATTSGGAAHASGPSSAVVSPTTVVATLPTAQAPRVPFIDTVGTYGRPISTDSELAQKYFDQGLRFTFGYYFPEAVASFTEATRQDPEYAMCYWGLALAISPNPNSRRFAAIQDDPQGHGWESIKKAMGLRGSASEVEQTFISALAVRYDKDRYPERGARDTAYVVAIIEVSERYVHDPEAATMVADAIMTTTPWEYWRPDGTARPNVLRAKDALERAIDTNENHPWANHLYIHLMENSQTPWLALSNAERLEATMPGEGHIVHMPSHIYLRVGQYARATASNRRSLAADAQLVELWGDAGLPTGVSTYGLSARVHPGHASDFLHAAAMMQGSYAAAEQAAQVMANATPLATLAAGNGSGQGRFVKGWLTDRRFGKWDAILDMSAPETDLPFVLGMWHFVRGGALVATGDLAGAEQQLAWLRTAAGDPLIAELPARRNMAPDVLNLAAEALRGEIEAAHGNLTEALAHLETAVRTEDGLDHVEPADWLIPVRHTLGAVLLEAGRASEAEAVYWEDLRRYPHNGWSLYGLMQSQRAQGKMATAADAAARFDEAWSTADTEIRGSRF